MTDRSFNIRRALLQELTSWQRAGLRDLPRVEPPALASPPVEVALTAQEAPRPAASAAEPLIP